MKFEEMKYSRPNHKAVLAELESIQNRIKNAENYEMFKKAFLDLDELMQHVDTQANLCYIRHTINTADEFYKQETDYFDEINPVLEEYITQINRAILESDYSKQLREEIPQTWFTKAEFGLKSMSPEIVEDLQNEAKLQSAYQALVASAKIPFEGETYTLASLQKKMADKNREVRKEATKAYWQWFADHEEEIGKIYSDMVDVRTRMAKKLGFENYVPLGYLKMQRLDYDKEDVEKYRENVLKAVVPVCTALYEKQAKSLGYPDFNIPAWDEKIEFVSGNPAPKHSRDEMVQAALKMYQDLSPETGEYFEKMVNQNLMDLDAKPHKAAGGYCTGLNDYKVPFIFANFNGTNSDVETLTHEAGHGFQAYSSRNIVPASVMWPTMESAEIHSMSMEFFTWPWMKDFFEEDTDKYYFSHLGGSVKFIPYGVLVDHFQHEVYEHPEWTHEQRMDCFRRLEKEYLPHKDYEGIDVLERGGWWMRQLHIFMNPFYYIDYTLAQVCALQFWKRLQDQDPKAFEDYKAICELGGTLPFKEIVKKANLKVPFEDGCLDETMDSVSEWFKDRNNADY